MATESTLRIRHLTDGKGHVHMLSPSQAKAGKLVKSAHGCTKSPPRIYRYHRDGSLRRVR